MLGVRDTLAGQLLIHTSHTKRSEDFIRLLVKLDQVYAPTVGQQTRPVILVLDNGPIHTSKVTRQALAQRPWLQIEWLPKYAPELNDIERDWLHLKQHYLANQTFADADDLDRRIHESVQAINHSRFPIVHACLPKAA